MNRLKFLLFAVVALALWGAQLAVVSPGLAAKGVEAAQQIAAAGPGAVALRLEGLRSQVQAAALRATAAPAARAKSARPEAPSADKVSGLRTAALEGLADALKEKVAVGAVTEAGALVAFGAGEPAAPPEGFDAKAAASAGAAGALLVRDGKSWVAFSAPLWAVDKGEVAEAGALFVAAPLDADTQALDKVVAELGLTAVGLAVEGKVVVGAGPDRKLLEDALKGGRAGQAAPIAWGDAAALGPLKLPAFTAGDAMGGKAVLAVGARKDLPGTPYEVLAVASTRGLMQGLADAQRFMVLSLLGLLLLTVVVALVLKAGGDEYDAPAMVAPQVQRPAQVAAPAAAAAADASGAPEAPEAPAPEPFSMPESPPPDEASPDDFHFPPSSAASAPPVPDEAPAPPVPDYEPGPSDAISTLPQPEAAHDPFAVLNDAQAPDESAGPDYGQDERERTVAYSLNSPALQQAMADAVPNTDPSAGALGSDFNPDQTRVAAVPKELLQASQRVSQEVTAVNPKMVAAAMPRVTPMAQTSEETHWQEVFRDFVATREKCGEASDGLTYDKFSQKLRKNKEQLVAKYNCRTVRFQVHVKEGKAALKATPVRD